MLAAFISQFLLVCHVVASPSTIHIVTGNHLDVGFSARGPNAAVHSHTSDVNNAFAASVMRRYTQVLDNHSAALGNAYLVQPWVAATARPDVARLLPCASVPPEGRLCVVGNETVASQLHALLADGTLSANGALFNAQVEFGTGPSLLRHLQVAADSIPGAGRSSTFSQRDVPGLTVAALPWLARANITFLSVGVNFCSAPPAVPPLFWWHHEASNTTILSTWHPGGYGGDTPADVAVVGDTGFLPLWFGDNLGAPNATVVHDDLAGIRAAFPNATLIFSSLDEAAAALAADPAAASLPTLTSEIGDTWMYGVAADPLKTARTRAIYRARDAHPEISVGDSYLFDLVASKLVEHTWGGDSKTFLHDNGNWSNRDFDAARDDWNYRVMEETWAEQLAYTDLALALAPPPMVDELATAFATLDAVDAPSLAGYRPVSLLPNGGAAVRLPGLADRVFFDARGSYRPPGGGLGFRFLYHTYDAADYARFLGYYMWPWGSTGCNGDFGKVNVSLAKPTSALWQTSLQAVWTADNSVWLLLTPDDKRAMVDYGAPGQVYLQLNFSEAVGSVTATGELRVLDKRPTRLPEATFLSFGVDEAVPWWSLSKLGYQVNASTVVLNGSQAIHGVDDQGFAAPGLLNVTSLDASLVVLGDPSPFPTLEPVSSPPRTASLLLHNNAWTANYPNWWPYGGGSGGVASGSYKVRVAATFSSTHS